MAFGTLTKKPNLLILITDEERYVQHWPAGWAAANLPSMQRLMAHGMTFHNAFTNACTCSPSRATLFTGTYPAHHGVTEVLEWRSSQPARDMQGVLKNNYPNMARMLRTAGYHMEYKGKWHLTRPIEYDLLSGYPRWTDVDRLYISDRLGFHGWNPPDAGDSTSMTEFGGGHINHDGRYTTGRGKPHRPEENRERSVVQFLRSYDGEEPFCLVVSLVNPHDVLAYPGTGSSNEGLPAYQRGGYHLSDFATLPGGFELPNNYNDDLSTKPWVQRQSRLLFDASLGPLLNDEERLNYVKFYAYLHTVVDKHIGTILDTLDECGRTDDTLIIRISDHGDMGLSHGGLRQKHFNAYEETIHIPMIFSNPRLFEHPQETWSLASLIDLMPTLATISEVPERDRWFLQGHDLTPILNDPDHTVQEHVLFTFDDVDSTLNIHGATHLRTLRKKDWKYSVYFDPITGYAEEYEMYCYEPGESHPRAARDPLEMVNLAARDFGSKGEDPAWQQVVAEKRQALHEELTALLEATGTLPDGIVWPKISGLDPLAAQYEDNNPVRGDGTG